MFSEKRIAFALLALLFAMQIVVLIARTDREPHADELEYLHTAWMMANGETIFRSFFQHHSPLLFVVIEPFAPHAEAVEVLRYAEAARLLAGFAGLCAMAAFAAVIARVSPMAAAFAVAAVFASGRLWLRVITDIRPEPFAMASFWIGAALILLPRTRIAAWAGFGLGLIAFAGLWTPKWPLCSAVLLVVALVRVDGGRRKIAMLSIAAAIAGVSLLFLHRIAPLDVLRFFVLDFNAAAAPHLLVAAPPAFGSRPFYDAPRLLSLPIVVVASALLLLAARFDRRYRPVTAFVALFAASVLEVRFLHPYPVVGTHSYALWGFSAAAIVVFAPDAIVTLLRRAKLSARLDARLPVIAQVTLFVAFLPHVIVQASFAQNDTGTYWLRQRALVTRLRPGDRVWIPPRRGNPVTVRDAHYYWFGFNDGVMNTAADLAATSRGARYLPPLAPMPLCAALRGNTSLRFAAMPDGGVAAKSERPCFDALHAAGRVRNTGSPRVFEILPAHP